MMSPREAANKRVLERDKYLSAYAKKFQCELCANDKCKECVRPCYCEHLRR